MNFRWNSGTILGGLASGHTDIVFILGEFHLVGLGEIEITIRDEDRLNAQSLGGRRIRTQERTQERYRGAGGYVMDEDQGQIVYSIFVHRCSNRIKDDLTKKSVEM